MKVQSFTTTPSPVHLATGQKASEGAPAEPSTSTAPPIETTEFGEGVRHLTGGLAGISLSLPGVYAGVLGGAVVGSLFGAGMGPAVSGLTSQGAVEFLGGIWSSTSVAAKIGMVVGGAGGLAGGFKLGTAAGNGMARLFGAAPTENVPTVRRGRAGRTASSLVTGVGAGSGLIGGGLIGAGLGATGSLLAAGFDLSTLSGPTLVGACVGAAAGTLIAGVGSYSLSQDALSLVDRVAESLEKSAESGDLRHKTTVALGGLLGAVTAAAPAAGILTGILLGVSYGDYCEGETGIGRMATWLGVATNVAGSVGVLYNQNPLWMLPAALCGAVGAAEFIDKRR